MNLLIGVLLVLAIVVGALKVVSWMLSGVAVVVLVVAWLVMSYNKFVSLRNRVQEAWSDIEVQLKRRHDLIPNLVNTVKGYAAHEQGTFDAVIEARSKAAAINLDTANATAADLQKLSAAEGALTQSLGKIFALAEAYPDLKANTNFLELQRELSDTENKVQASRRFYNGVVKAMTDAVQMFPGNLIAGLFGFAAPAFFDVEESEKAVPNVAF